MLPIIMPDSLLIAAIIDVVSSGREVPIATAVIPIIVSLTPSTFAIDIAESTKSIAPILRPISPNTMNIIFL